ncbi:hypothetical protein GCM10009672_20040 [Nesterenkonia lutea]
MDSATTSAVSLGRGADSSSDVEASAAQEETSTAAPIVDREGIQILLSMHTPYIFALLVGIRMDKPDPR